MARDHARVNVTIWGDPAFRDLPPSAQHLYLTLWTSPELTYCGTHDWRPARLTGLAAGWTRQDIENAADCLTARHFLVLDLEREEVLIRSWIRWDGLMKQPRMAISCITAYAAVSSATLRQVIVHQLLNERKRHPSLACWSDPRVQEVLTHPSVSAKDLSTPADPFRDGFTHGFGVGLGQTQSKVSVPPTPAPSPATTPSLPAAPDSGTGKDDDAEKKPRRKPERPLPESWKPNARHYEIALEKDVDIEAQANAFRNHAATHDRRARDWDAAFRTWLDRARPSARPAAPAHSPWDTAARPPRRTA